MRVRINAVRGQPAVPAMSLGERVDTEGRILTTILIYDTAQIPDGDTRPAGHVYVTEAEVGEDDPGVARMLADNVLVQVPARRGRPPKSAVEGTEGGGLLS